MNLDVASVTIASATRSTMMHVCIFFFHSSLDLTVLPLPAAAAAAGPAPAASHPCTVRAADTKEDERGWPADSGGATFSVLCKQRWAEGAFKVNLE